MLDFRFLSEPRLQLEGELCFPNVLQVAKSDPSLSIFVSLIERSGLEEIFLCAGPFTTLIPTNDAFHLSDPAFVAFLLRPENADLLRDFLLYHIIGGVELSTEIVAGPLVTIQGQSVEAREDPLSFNGATVMEADIPACNGVIDKLEDVLLFPGFPLPTLAPVPPTPPTIAPTPTGTPGTDTFAPTLDVSTTSPLRPTSAPTSEVSPGTETAAPTPNSSGMITLAPTSGGSGSTNAPTPTSSRETIAPTPIATVRTISPTPLRTSRPTEQLIRVKVTDYYMALVVPALDEEPSQDVIDSLFNVTTQFWVDTFEEYYANSDIQFRGLDNAIVEFLYNASLPEPGFNMYFEWDTIFLYEFGSPEPPSAAATFGIMASADLVTYILDYVRTIPELVSTNEVDFQAVERLEQAGNQRPENFLGNSTVVERISQSSIYEAGGAINASETEYDSYLTNQSDSNAKSTTHADTELKQPASLEGKPISLDETDLDAPAVATNSDLPSPTVSKGAYPMGKLSGPQIQHTAFQRNETLKVGENNDKDIHCSACIESLVKGSRVRVPLVGSRVRVGSSVRAPQGDAGTSRATAS